LWWSEVPDCDPAAFTIETMPDRYAEIGDPGAGIDEAVGSLEKLLELAKADADAGLPDAPWPPHFEKQADEAPRVQPSKRRAGRQIGSAASGSAASGSGAVDPATAPAPGRSSSPTGRRQSSMPLIEIARAASKADAMAGLERWKQRHPAAAALLEPADVLVDSMRGRSSTWTRIRLNLRHIPAAERPPQEALEVDYNPWEQFTGRA